MNDNKIFKCDKSAHQSCLKKLPVVDGRYIALYMRVDMRYRKNTISLMSQLSGFTKNRR